jgi:hypothetical protein
METLGVNVPVVETPVPDQLPPAGLPVKLKGVPLAHVVLLLPALTEGVAFTVTVLVAVPVHPFCVTE